jgi:hypothetical protein
LKKGVLVPREELHDSDEEEHGFRGGLRNPRQTPARSEFDEPAGTHTGRGTNRNTPVAASTTNATSGVAGTNRRYRDVDPFYGDTLEQKRDWPRWKAHLYSKFRQSAVLFPEEEDKMDYCRDALKGGAYEIVKSRAELGSLNPFTTVVQITDLLDSVYRVFDPVAEADAKVHDPSFRMCSTNKNETFDEYYARYLAPTVILNYSDTQNISCMKRNLTDRLRLKLADGTKYTVFEELVTRCRQMSLDLAVADKLREPRGNRGGRNSGGGNSGGGNSGGGKPATTGNTTTGNTTTGGAATTNATSNTSSSTPKKKREQYPSHVWDKIKNEGRCSKCLEKGHMRSSNDAPCKGQKGLTVAEGTAKMAGINVEPTGEDSGND